MRILLLMSCIQPAGYPASDPVQTFDQEFERLRVDLKIPGMSVAVLQEHEIVFARGFGYADLGEKIPATENTPIIG